MFKVVPDQLRISDGWVRCGECKEVFDASVHLVPLEDQASAEDVSTLVNEAPLPAAAAESFSLEEAERDAPAPSQPGCLAAAGFANEQTPSALDFSAAAVHESAVSDALPPMVLREEDAAPVQSDDAVLSMTAKLAPSDEDESSDPALDAEEVGFVRDAKRKAFWQRPIVRAVLGIFVLVLLGSLGLQALLHERHRLAAMEPSLRPLLQALCTPFECTLEPLRQISDIVIDSSSFLKGRGGSYQLGFALKNRASVPLAVPAIELTLTDALDQPVLRRVLLPSEMAAPAELPASGEWTASVAVLVNSGAPLVVGYRLLAFYP